MRKIFNRIIIFFCILALSLCAVFFAFKPVKTQASVIAVGGAVIAALSAFMAASGIEITASGIESGDLGTVWENISHDFSYDNKALTDWYGDGNAVNFLIGKDNAAKTVLISTQLATWFNELKKWLVSNHSISSSGATNIYNSGTVIKLASGSYSFCNVEHPSRLESVVPVNGSTTIRINEYLELYVSSTYTSENDWTIDYSYYVTESNVLLGSGERTYQVGSFWNNNYPPFYAFYNSNGTLALGLYFGRSYGGGVGFSYGLQSSIPLQIDIRNLSISDMSLNGTLTDGYSDFEQALEDAQTDAGEDGKIAVGVGDIPVPIPVTQENLIDGIIDAAGENTLTGDLVGGYTDEKEAEEETDSEKVPTVSDYENGVVIVDGLEDFFPFCIPFDLYALVEKFNVPAKAPKITYNMNFANKFEAETIELDFAPWENAARIFRVLIVIGFAIFLILKTRDLIRG